MPDEVGAVPGSEFDALIEEMRGSSLAKAMGGDDDQTVADAAAEGDADNKENGDGDGEGNGDTDGAGDGGDDDDADGEVLGKAITVTMEDGTEQVAFDATPLVKSLISDSKVLKETVAKQGECIAALHKQVKELTAEAGSMLKALRADVAKVRGTAQPRRATLSIVDKPTVAGAAATSSKPSGADVMAKAMEAHSAGKLNAADVALIEMRIQSGRDVPEQMLKAIGA